ncbi:MAG: hypothetical protein IRZ23_05505 [Acetobacteraceae bacterium]|nr:hypothetical protein [Acetobacteraceae bacterium]
MAETEDETAAITRLEAALERIAANAARARKAAAEPGKEAHPALAEIVLHLDTIIAKLKAVLAEPEKDA